MSSRHRALAVPPSQPRPGGDPGARPITAIVAVLSLAVFMSGLDLFIVNLAFPYIGRQYPGTSLSFLSWVLNGYTIVFAAVLVPAGRFADRIGRRLVSRPIGRREEEGPARILAELVDQDAEAAVGKTEAFGDLGSREFLDEEGVQGLELAMSRLPGSLRRRGIVPSFRAARPVLQHPEADLPIHGFTISSVRPGGIKRNPGQNSDFGPGRTKWYDF